MLPKWALDVISLLEYLDKDVCAAESNFRQSPERSVSLAKTLIKPVLGFAYRKLCHKLPVEPQSSFSPEARQELIAWLEERLTKAVRCCVELHFRAFVAVAHCSHKKCSIEQLAVEVPYRPCGYRLIQLLQANPPLAKILIILVSQWVNAVSELSERLASDRQLLAKVFQLSHGAKVARLRIGLSDPKSGGRSVAELTFRGGAVIIYKPRDVLEKWNGFHF